VISPTGSNLPHCAHSTLLFDLENGLTSADTVVFEVAGNTIGRAERPNAAPDVTLVS